MGEQTGKFMMGMVNEETLTFDSLDAISVITSLEQSGLRKEICLYSGESYDSTYNLRQFLTEEYANEIDESIALNNREINVNDSLKNKWDSIFQARFDQLPPERKKREKEMEKKREERRRWGSTPTPKGLFHYALLKTDTSFSAYCLLRSMELSPAITPALTELTNTELESWNVQIIFMIDYYLGDILFLYRRHMVTGY
ncbi:MAG: hypothetical protein AAFY41_09530 [Bacteroidota bacterium]